MSTDLAHIRNFCIIAHIDHGKSTLADRLLEVTGVVEGRKMREQVLDGMDLERERGITIKAKSVTIPFEHHGVTYIFNLIDTPGHVDFNYEVSRSMHACEGALLLVDASQGVEAQTVANAYLAVDAGLEIIPVINKVDLVNARPDEVVEEIESVVGLDASQALRVSAKTGVGVEDVLRAIVERVPPPGGDAKKDLRALIFDAVSDEYRGVIVSVRVLDGVLETRRKIRMLGAASTWDVDEVGVFQPDFVRRERLSAGEVGYLVCNIKGLSDVRVGDTVTLESTAKTVAPLPGFKTPRPMVYCGLYPTQSGDFENLRKALRKLSLNDSSFTFAADNSDALGFGFRCGFLGLLHMEIVQERLERESDVDIVQTAPNVTYEALLKTGEVMRITSPSSLPEANFIEEVREPFVRVSMIVPTESIGPIMKLCTDRRGVYRSQEYLGTSRVMIVFDMPLAEIIVDFYDKLKSCTRGYGTMDYDFMGYRADKLVRLRVLVAGVDVDALSAIVHRERAEQTGRRLLQILRREIPRHLFEVPLQAAIGGKIIARENIKALRKNVTAKCYGGDVTRKRKLLDKQKEGKKRMKSVGNVEIPQKAFMSVLGITSEER